MKLQKVLYQKSQKLIGSHAHCTSHTIGTMAITMYITTIETEWKAIECSE